MNGPFVQALRYDLTKCNVALLSFLFKAGKQFSFQGQEV